MIVARPIPIAQESVVKSVVPEGGSVSEKNP